MIKKILVATTNAGKFAEITAELTDLQFDFVNLKDLKLDKFDVDEPHSTTWQNALEKAKFFAKKSGLLTIAEDTGLFIDYLKGEPGVKSKRYGATAAEGIKKILEKLKNVPEKKRTAYLENMSFASIFYYPPLKKLFSEMPLLEKNMVSQRGKMVGQLKYFLKLFNQK
ncbi:MAG: Non-canonical purine NTP pyrophosphatase [Candidatus Magasanikbacteria bacterium GW2011_GWA2_40_10]|uniref:Non-canonical purine NTP pyrophosphatase n=1 Tax=Candidatus Magasanikbacteria bacterium GW2011_GWA2_40_10 TaxID=1619037 RepID=A0A0G0TA75_9BACT|nr:MAG: Non-canonical purine NTP pyrophosphatase [Candidatus Magasanikbacteria bacterium GW2011_GWA2_40_10]